MKLLINLCAHDGIISHYNGVGTMAIRYITTLVKALNTMNVDFKINLFTPDYNKNSFGYSATTEEDHNKIKNINIFRVSNGSNAKINYGKPNNWKELSKNTAEIINKIDINAYDKIFTIFNDTPFAGLAQLIESNPKHKKIWIPHSTIKIHEVDSAVKDYEGVYDERLVWENNAIKFINEDEDSYLGSIGNFISKHLIEEYNLLESKILKITNGELLTETCKTIISDENAMLFDKIKDFDSILFSFGRAETYKNLDATMYLGEELNINTIVVAQSYFKEQPILNEYKKIAEQTSSLLYIDPPFDFPKYILQNFTKPIILLVSSKRETMGLIVNEIRKLNRDNILVVANDIDGIKEQINDTKDGLLVDLENIKKSRDKILNYFNQPKINEMNHEAQLTLKSKYDLEKNVHNFLISLMAV